MIDDREHTASSLLVKVEIRSQMYNVHCNCLNFLAGKEELFGLAPREQHRVHMYTWLLDAMCAIARAQSSGHGQLSTDLLAQLGFKHIVSCAIFVISIIIGCVSHDHVVMDACPSGVDPGFCKGGFCYNKRTRNY